MTARLNNGLGLSKRMALVLVASGFLLVTVNLLLVQQNKTLKSQIGNTDGSLELKPGSELPPIEGIDIYGGKLRFDYGQDHRRTLLLVFSPGCYACDENLDNWRKILKGIDKELVRAVGVSLNPKGTMEFMTRLDMPGLPIIAEVSPKVRLAYNLVLTPQTILIGPDGKAEKVWSGTLQPEEKEEIGLRLNSLLLSSNK